MKKTLLSLLVCMPLLANAQGFQLNLQGAKQVAMGQSVAGAALDQAVTFYNPGAMSFVDQGVIAGAAATIVGVKFRKAEPSRYTAEPIRKVNTPFNAYAVLRLKESSKLSFGLGVYTPFGSSINWGDSWDGRFVLQSISLRAISIQPTVSYKITDKIGIGAGFVYTNGSVNLQRGIPLASQSGQNSMAELDGSGNGYSFNVGVFAKPTDKLSVGLSYRSQIDITVDAGNVTYTVPAAAASNFPSDNTFKATLPLPQVASLGLGYQVNDKLLVTADVNFVGWSAYDTLRFEYAKTSAVVTNTKEAREYKDVFAYRLGAQYMLNDAFALRGGFSIGRTPVQNDFVSPDGPDANRYNLSVGAGYKFGQFMIDGAMLVGLFEKKTASSVNPYPGTYALRSFVPMINVSYIFSKKTIINL